MLLIQVITVYTPDYNRFDKSGSFTFEKNVLQNILSMHNKKHKKQYSLKYIYTDSFIKLFNQLSNVDEKKLVLGHSRISRTAIREVNFDFSPPYLINTYGIYSTEMNKNMPNGKKLGVSENSSLVPYAKQYQTKNSMTLVFYSDRNNMLNSLINGNVDFLVLDMIYPKDEQIKFVSIFPYSKNELCYMFPKNSLLRKELKGVMLYYFKSRKYHELIKDSFGDYIKKIYTKNIKRLN